MLVKKAGTILLNLETKKIGLVYRKKDKSYTFPKGHLEKGETLQECAIRETEEETLRTNHLLINKEIDVLRYTTPLGENVENYMYIAIDDGPSSRDIPMCDREFFEWIEYEDVGSKLIFSNLKLLWNKIKEPIYTLLENHGQLNSFILKSLSIDSDILAPTLYIITGPAGVGKSTVSKELAKSNNKSVLIEGDDIYHQVVGGYVPAWKDGNHLDVFWDICLNMFQKYISYGYNVIFNYIVTPDIIDRIKSTFKDCKIKFVILLADEKTILRRDSQRPEDCQMKERCIILLNNFKNKNYSNNNILNTTDLSVIETIDIINKENRFLI